MPNSRPPIVVILGHVDHGKTSLLDALRKTDVAASEAGGITQSTRAFQVQVADFGPVTFIDTPGHEAFSQMRSRGGHIADIALLIVSGSDGVMPQTKESIATIAAAGIPFIVVATKADLPEFNLDKVKTQLAENGVLVEGFGGDVPQVSVSAKTGKGLDELLEVIQLVTQLHPLTASSDISTEAVVLESSRDAKRGASALVIIKNGTLAMGQSLYIGAKEWGKVKGLTNTSGERVNTAPVSTPVEILGLSEIPPVGSVISSLAQADKSSTPAGMDFATKGEGLRVIFKADVGGSLEAILASLPKDIVVVASSSGDVSESDVLLAQSTKAMIVGFNVKVPTSVAKLAEIDKVKVVTANIIYELLDQMEQLAHPKDTDVVTGQAQILAEFKIDANRVAGCKCVSGEIKRSDFVKIGDKEVRVKSLRIGKNEVDAVKLGQEFGAIFSPAIDFKIGDTITAFTR